MVKTPTTKMPISAKTGRIVTSEYAKAHPSTTVVMNVPKPKPPKK